MSVMAILLLFFISSNITSAFLITDTNRIIGEVIGGGYVNMTYGSPVQNGSKIAVGQPIIGITNDSTYKVCFGVFCTGIYGSDYGKFSMNFSGRLNYSNGTAIIYSPIKITINYLQYQYYIINSTDGVGAFFIKLDDLPQVMMNKDLNISINLQGNVEAVYNCLYNHTSITKQCCPKPIIQPCT